MADETPTSREEIIEARERLVELGLVEDSGERRPGRDGKLAIVWRRTKLALLVDDYRRAGFSFEEAIIRAKTAVARPD